MMADLAAALATALTPVLSKLHDIEARIDKEIAISEILVARVTPGYLSVSEVARAAKLSKSVVQNRFAAFLEELPGKKGYWIPIDVARRIGIPKRLGKGGRR